MQTDSAGNSSCSRREALKALAAWGAAPLANAPLDGSHAAPLDNRQPAPADAGYRLQFSIPLGNLVGDLDGTERGDPRRQSALPYSQWYSAETRRHWHSWGPPARHFPPLANLERAPIEWQRERVVATAARFIGYAYQHHHIPDWDPPAGWPWKACCAGRNGKGVDCSNLTSFVYNQAFGIRFTAAVSHQAEAARALEGSERPIPIRTVELPKGYQRRCDVLRTGDLVYIRGRVGGPITHVVIWVGSIGRSPSGVPLVIDSHGSDVLDDAGRPIPCGVHLRPFREDSWYHRCASHAQRVFGNRVG